MWQEERVLLIQDKCGTRLCRAIQNSLIGYPCFYKPVSVRDILANTARQSFTYTGKTLNDWSIIWVGTFVLVANGVMVSMFL